MDIDKLKTEKKVVGVNQSTEAIREGKAALVFIAADTDLSIKEKLLNLCKKKGAAVTMVKTRRELGTACGIDLGACVAVILK